MSHHVDGFNVISLLPSTGLGTAKTLNSPFLSATIRGPSSLRPPSTPEACESLVICCDRFAVTVATSPPSCHCDNFSLGLCMLLCSPLCFSHCFHVGSMLSLSPTCGHQTAKWGRTDNDWEAAHAIAPVETIADPPLACRASLRARGSSPPALRRSSRAPPCRLRDDSLAPSSSSLPP